MTVYLLHFSQPIGDLSNPRGQAQHYLDYTDNLAERLERHRAGNGARIMEVVEERGIGWELVRTWEGGRDVEWKLKRRHNSRKLCPICTPTSSRPDHADPHI
jgi:putative endonuclease